MVRVDGHRRVQLAQERYDLGDGDEPVGRAVIERPQQHAIDDGKDGGIGADAQSKCEYGYSRKARLTHQTADCVAEVTTHGYDTDYNLNRWQKIYRLRLGTYA